MEILKFVKKSKDGDFEEGRWVISNLMLKKCVVFDYEENDVFLRILGIHLMEILVF